MSRDSGIRPALHRCPRCLHPMAPGPGVPASRFGAFGVGIATDCNECGFGVPAGRRMLSGGSSAADDPNRGTAARWAPLLVRSVVLGFTTLAFLAVALVTITRIPDDGSFKRLGLIAVLLGMAGVSAAALWRVGLRSLVWGRGHAGRANCSTWLLSQRCFWEWAPVGLEILGPRDRGPVLAASVRARTVCDREGRAQLAVRVVVADDSVLPLHMHPSQVSLLIARLQRAHAVMAWAAPPQFGNRRRIVMPAVLSMRIPAGEPGLEDAAAAARTIAFACLDLDPPPAPPDAPFSQDGVRHAFQGLPDRPLAIRMRPLRRLLGSVISVGTALGSPALAVWGVASFLRDTPPHPYAGTIAMVGTIALIALGVLRHFLARHLVLPHGGESHETWESCDLGFVAVEHSGDRQEAVSLVLPAATLTLTESRTTVDVEGRSAMIRLHAGRREIRRIVVDLPARDASEAAGRVMHAAGR